MADDVLKVDVIGATSIFWRIFFMFCMCLSLYVENKYCVEP